MDGIRGYTGNRIRCQQFASVIDPFREIDPMESYGSLKSTLQYLRADREHAKCFFSWNGLEEEEGEETADDTYYIESVVEGDQD